MSEHHYLAKKATTFRHPASGLRAVVGYARIVADVNMFNTKVALHAKPTLPVLNVFRSPTLKNALFRLADYDRSNMPVLPYKMKIIRKHTSIKVA